MGLTLNNLLPDVCYSAYDCVSLCLECLYKVSVTAITGDRRYGTDSKQPPPRNVCYSAYDCVSLCLECLYKVSVTVVTGDRRYGTDSKQPPARNVC